MVVARLRHGPGEVAVSSELPNDAYLDSPVKNQVT
jgi:hypothetical protein